jgi:hypothetical protein
MRFLLSRLHLRSLVGLDNRKAIYLALQTLPMKIYSSFDDAMERIEKQPDQDRRRAKQVLMWISCVLRPLTVEELRHALTVELGSDQMSMDALLAKSRLISVCAGLVTVDQRSQIIRLIHDVRDRLASNRADPVLSARGHHGQSTGGSDTASLPPRPSFPHGLPCLNNLGAILGRRFERTGSMDDLDRAIETVSVAVQATSQDHPVRPAYLNNLGNMFRRRFERTGSLSDLNRAVEHFVSFI